MGSLYECLRENRLEKYYPILRINGITTSESLANLSQEDCIAIGVTSPDDRRRLIDLINIIKSVLTGQQRSPYEKNTQSKNRHGQRKRNRSSQEGLSSSRGDGRDLSGLSAPHNVKVKENRPGNSSTRGRLYDAATPEIESESEESQEEESSDQSDYEPAKKHLNASPPAASAVVRKSRVKSAGGYNYGVPKISSQAATKSKSRSDAQKVANEEKIKVCVRKRPLNKREVKTGETDIVSAESTSAIVVNEAKQTVDLSAYISQHEFIFDEVFDESCSNEDVYIRAMRPLINCVFTGGSATCFAYGQTGAGKTHTMMGSREVPGMYLLAAHDVFSIIVSQEYGSGLQVWLSFFEIYCGQLFDLLNKRNRLYAREDGSHQVCIAGLTETQVEDVTSVMQVLEYGNTVRSKGATGVNPDSSRSHAVLQMEIRNSQDKRVGRMSFIDLAGSERASDMTDSDRQTRMEGAEINQSLLALKECIRSIDQDSKHTPFRQSKLTHILKDSFVGNSRTCMIANISPCRTSCEHTLNTLRYADRVKELRREAAPLRSSAATNILMNIPLGRHAPNLFNPSNVLCSSTPTRHKASSRMADITLDPSETPIKGHGMRKKATGSKSATKASAKVNSSSPKQNFTVKTSRDMSARVSVVRHTASSQSFMSGAKEELPRGQESNSSSDHTESDSCNITEKKKTQTLSLKRDTGPRVSSSQDTDNDFQTTDFNTVEEEAKDFNDLNRTGEKQGDKRGVAEAAKGPVAKKGGVHLSSSGHPLPVVGEPEDVTRASLSVPPGALQRCKPQVRPKIYTDSPTKATSVERGSVVHEPPEKDIPKTESSHHTSSSLNNNNQKSPPAGQSYRTEDLVDNIEDDMLFLSASHFNRDNKSSTLASKSAIENSPLSARNREGPRLKTPQDPSLKPEIPAVLTAMSSDLTTFSNRSPRKFLQTPEASKAPTKPSLVLYNEDNIDPTVSRPKIPRTPPASQQNEPTFFSHGEQVDKMSDYESLDEKDDEDLPPPIQRFPTLRLKMPPPEPNWRALSDPPVHQIYDVKPLPVSDRDSSGNSGSSEGNELALLSTEHWYYTPANIDAHVNASVQKSSQAVEGRARQEKQPPNMPKHFLNYDEEETDLKKLDCDLSEFAPFQRKIIPPNSSSMQTTRQDVASRLKSIFSKNPSERSDLISSSNNSVFDRTPKLPYDPEYRGFNQHLSQNNGSDLKNLFPSDYFSSKNRGKDISSADKPKLNEQDRPLLLQGVSFDSSDRSVPAILDSNGKGNNSPSSEPPKLLLKSPVTRQSPPDRDNEPMNASYSNGKQALLTEKLSSGSAFSPIHPQPVTTSASIQRSNGAISKDLISPRPKPRQLDKSGDDEDGEENEPVRDQNSANDLRKSSSKSLTPQQRLIAAHEDQLQVVTSLCKIEMKLLLGAKAGSKGLEEYAERLGNLLCQKMEAISLMQEQLSLCKKSFTLVKDN